VYTVSLKKRAEKQLAALPKDIASLILDRLETLANNPRPAGVKKLAGHQNIYRLRVGDYRIVYHIEDKHCIVVVIKVGHRQDIYRDL
jgi:mRNA interferase RelE/StbE